MKLLKSKTKEKKIPAKNGFLSFHDKLERNYKRQHIIIILLIAVILMLVSYTQKPPMVIQYHPNGQEETVSKSGVEKLDVKLFVSHFVRNFNYFDSYGLDENIPRALNMMTSKLRAHYKKEIKPDRIREIKKSSVKTRTKIETINYKKREGGKSYDVTVIYRRTLIAFGDTPAKELLIRGEMILERVKKRSKRIPYRLLVSQYKEFAM